MGTLGQYLRGARETRGVDLRDAAQHTRISIHYLKALEEEDFSRLPGEVFVKGFLKNYGKFLRLDESEVMKKYEELRPRRVALSAVADKAPAAADSERKTLQWNTIEPFILGSGIVIALMLFLFAALPKRPPRDTLQVVTPLTSGQTVSAPGPVTQPEKLYLEVVALENTWLLLRTDNSPQKKALLKKGESLIWSADERFLLSYGSAGALKLMLNNQELTVNEPGNAVVRDLVIIASGLVIRKSEPEYAQPAKPKRKPLAETPVREQQLPAAAPREQQAAPAPVPPAPLLQEQPNQPKPQTP